MGAGFSEATASVVVTGTDTSTYASASFVLGTETPSGSTHTLTINGVDFIGVVSASAFTDSSTQRYYTIGSIDNDPDTGFGPNLANAIGAASVYSKVSASYIASSNTLVLSGSSAGSVGNVSVTTSSIATSTTKSLFLLEGVTALEGGIDSATGGSETSFILHTLADGEILNSTGNIGENEVLSGGTRNNVRWEVSNVNNKKGTFTLLVRRGDDTIKQKQILETWNNLSLDPNANNYIDKVIGNQDIGINNTDITDPFLTYSGDYQNKSKYIRVETLKQTIDYLDENGNVRVGDASGSLPGVGSGSLGGVFGGGKDGTISHPLSESLNEGIGQITQGFDLNVTAQQNQYLSALNLLSNADEYDFNLLLIPGVIRNQTGHAAVITKAVDICEARGDAFTIIDTVDYSENSLGNVNTQAKALNSNYAATYWPWVQSPDSQTGQNVWVPPSVVMGGVYAFNDKVGAPWNAPAGLNRGVIDTAVQAKRKLTHKNRDELYEKNVNPIATFPGQGICVWGQKTLQKKSSALDRVNVRRLLIKVKKFISASSRFLVFEQNNTQTRERFLNIANPYLEQVQAQSGLNAFRVVMDETNNTPDIVDRNILYGQLFLQPTKTAEFIVLDFTVQNTGATFSG